MPEGGKRRPPWLLLAILAVGLLLVYGGFSVYGDQTSGTWTVGGSLLEGGRVVVGDVEGAGYGDVGKTIEVRIHGTDHATKPSLGTPIVLWALGAPIVLLALLGLRGWWRAGRSA